jgi:hypothetical protein
MSRLIELVKLTEVSSVSPEAYHLMRDRLSVSTIKQMAELLLQCKEAMEAFTDPEGNMPAQTGEFYDLAAALSALSAFDRDSMG